MLQVALAMFASVPVLTDPPPVAPILAPRSPRHDGDLMLADRRPPFRIGKRQNGGLSSAVNPSAPMSPSSGGGGFGFPHEGVDLLAWITCADFGLQVVSGADCWGYVSPAGREYGIIGLSHGTGFVDVTDPRHSVIVGFIDGPPSLWRDIQIYQTYAYAVSEAGDGIQVIDLTQIDQGVVTLVNTITNGGFTTATHTVIIDEASGFLYRCGGGSHGLRIYDLAVPSSPAYITSYDPRYVHECQVVTYTEGDLKGRQIAYCFGGYNGGFTSPGVDILDVTDKNNIVLLQELLYTGAAYSHQGWLSPDTRYLYIDDELDEYWQGLPTTTIMLDVSTLGSAFEVGTFTNGNRSIGHNMYTVGNRIFQANYRSGLRVFDATDPLAPTEIAYFDTWTTDDEPAFNGLWGVYPFLPSGTLIGSDLEKGMFVWRLGRPGLLIDYPRGLPHFIAPEVEGVLARVRDGRNPLQAGSVELHVDRGNGFETIPAIDRGAPHFELRFPTAECGTAYAWYLTARTVSGDEIRDPVAAPAEVYRARAGAYAKVLFADDFETDQGWTTGDPSDTATSGVWERAAPQRTLAQPDADQSKDPGTLCFGTGAAAGASLGEGDVDDGVTTLRSPSFDLSGTKAAVVSYWRWFSNAAGPGPAEDVFRVEVSADDGTTWVPVETVGPNDAESSGGWRFAEFRVSDHVTPTAQVRVRFIAGDLLIGSVVEAAIDEFEVDELECDVSTGTAGRPWKKLR